MTKQEPTNSTVISGNEEPKKLEKAILVGTYQGTKSHDICVEYLKELAELAYTYGLSTVSEMPCVIRKYDAATYIGKGKVQEIADLALEVSADVVIFDEEISPSQQRNLEKALKLPVMDRTEIILGIFSQRAQTKEARLQIELAQLKYQFPRLKRMWTHLSRQRTSGAYLKGEGEKQIELDKRMLQQRMDHISQEIKSVRLHRETQRQQRHRSGIPTFAIIGYTNAGKSTLLNALTEANVFVENKLFATLDTTTRQFTLPNNQEILLVDTVGFIRKIPHTLVASFKSTLEESLDADILLHLIDVSHPLAEKHAEATYHVLKELHVDDSRTIITILNKVDALSSPKMVIDKFRIKYPKTVPISALHKTGLDTLLELMVHELKQLRTEVNLSIPQKDYALVSEITRHGKILHQDYEENQVLLRCEIPKIMLHRIEKYIQKAS